MTKLVIVLVVGGGAIKELSVEMETPIYLNNVYFIYYSGIPSGKLNKVVGPNFFLRNNSLTGF